MWERIDHWLRNIMPVAEEYGIQMACHPSDPGIGYGVRYRGVARVLGVVDGFKRMIDLYDSPYNGLNFCLACFSEDQQSPASNIYDVLRYLTVSPLPITFTRRPSRFLRIGVHLPP